MQLWVQVILGEKVATSNMTLSRVTKHIFHVVQAHVKKGNTMIFLLMLGNFGHFVSQWLVDLRNEIVTYWLSLFDIICS